MLQLIVGQNALCTQGLHALDSVLARNSGKIVPFVLESHITRTQELRYEGTGDGQCSEPVCPMSRPITESFNKLTILIGCGRSSASSRKTGFEISLDRADDSNRMHRQPLVN